MPQDSFDPSEQKWTGFRYEMQEVVRPEGRAWDVKVLRRGDDDVWRTVWVGRWTGVMLDCASTMATEVTTAFLFGETRDLARAAAGVHKVARAHQRRHDF